MHTHTHAPAPAPAHAHAQQPPKVTAEDVGSLGCITQLHNGPFGDYLEPLNIGIDNNVSLSPSQRRVSIIRI